MLQGGQRALRTEEEPQRVHGDGLAALLGGEVELKEQKGRGTGEWQAQEGDRVCRAEGDTFWNIKHCTDRHVPGQGQGTPELYCLSV